MWRHVTHITLGANAGAGWIVKTATLRSGRLSDTEYLLDELAKTGSLASGKGPSGDSHLNELLKSVPVLSGSGAKNGLKIDAVENGESGSDDVLRSHTGKHPDKTFGVKNGLDVGLLNDKGGIRLDFHCHAAIETGLRDEMLDGGVDLPFLMGGKTLCDTGLSVTGFTGDTGRLDLCASLYLGLAESGASAKALNVNCLTCLFGGGHVGTVAENGAGTAGATGAAGRGNASYLLWGQAETSVAIDMGVSSSLLETVVVISRLVLDANGGIGTVTEKPFLETVIGLGNTLRVLKRTFAGITVDAAIDGGGSLVLKGTA